MFYCADQNTNILINENELTCQVPQNSSVMNYVWLINNVVQKEKTNQSITVDRTTMSHNATYICGYVAGKRSFSYSSSIGNLHSKYPINRMFCSHFDENNR